MKPFSTRLPSRSAPQDRACAPSGLPSLNKPFGKNRPDTNLTCSCTIRPSRTHRAVSLLAGLMAGLAILICNMSVLLQVTAWLMTGAALVFQWRNLQKHWQLQHHAGDENTANHWALQSDAGEYIDGKLLQQGYRSAFVLVLVIGAESGRRIRLPVWIDSVSSAQFSYLNLQLMFNTHSRI